MAAKIIAILSLAVLSSALPLVAVQEPEAHYEFQYSVNDPHTGDNKQQHEARNGHSVQGSYSLVQPDGVLRIVDYTADEHHGFNANVRYEGHPTPVHTKIAYAPAPVAKYAYAAAPVAKIAYAPAPVAKLTYAPAPIAYAQAPAKFAYAAAPIAKVAYAAPVAKLAYAGAPHSHVTFSSPIISYHH